MAHRVNATAADSGLRSVRRDIGIAGLTAILVGVVSFMGWLGPVDRGISDLLLRLTPRVTTDVPVMAIVLDDRLASATGPARWPRSLIAEAVSAAYDAGAAAVCLDLLLVGNDANSEDARLEEALAQGRSILAAALDPDGSWILPDPRFGGADRAAHVHAEVGPDGVARVIAATKQAEGLSLPSFCLAAARVLRPDIVIAPGASLRPDFRPPPLRILQIPIVDYLSDPDDHPSLENQLVFVGSTATGSGDRLMVPTHPGPAPAPGVLVHASATASILRGGLIRPLSPGWLLVGVFLVSLAPQLLRSKSGALRPWILAAAVGATFVGSIAALELGHHLVSVSPLITALILSAVLREGIESRAAQKESGLLLSRILEHIEPDRMPDVPRSPGARLSAVRDLQAVVLRGDAARRKLLEGMHNGVVMWDAGGRTLISNSAATRLWGRTPGKAEFELLPEGDATDTAVFERNGMKIAVAVYDLGEGGMALLRDVSAEFEVEQERREMQRMVSHELKTPLASIAGFGETLQRYELDAEEQQRVATLIRGEAVRLGEMVATFLDLERLGRDADGTPTESIDIGQLVRGRLEILAESARAKKQHISSEIEPGVRVRGSEVLLARVVDNLVGNAVKYSVEGDTIEVRLLREEATAVLTVADHGPGIPEEESHRVFERFYRVPGCGASGSGLGLAFAKEVAAWHGGCINVESGQDQGSTFTMRFPAED